MFKLLLKNRQGLILAEVLVATLIFIAILGIMYGIQVVVNDLFHISKEKVDLQAEARITLNYMNFELRNATRVSEQNPSPNLTIPSEPNNRSIIFYLPEDKNGDGLITDSNGNIEWATNKPMHYQYVPGQKMIMRVIPHGGKDKILARNATDVRFIDADIDPSLGINELKIILTLNRQTIRNRDISYTLTSIVRLRN